MEGDEAFGPSLADIINLLLILDSKLQTFQSSRRQVFQSGPLTNHMYQTPNLNVKKEKAMFLSFPGDTHGFMETIMQKLSIRLSDDLIGKVASTEV
jgi:hypothetical protein